MKSLKLGVFGLLSVIAVATSLSSCEADKPAPKTTTRNYPFNTGQLGTGSAYVGTHVSTTGTIKLTEDGDKTTLNVTLSNTITGSTYNVHVHDADTASSTGYNQAPNAALLAGTITGTGGSATKDFTSTMSYAAITETYAGGFLVVHDPTVAISTTNLTTFLIVALF